MPEKKPNRLLHEKSPYLLQHAYNPVQWYAWGSTALTQAQKENKPIFLSIGYSTCHWCHVMEHESFEDEDTAQLLNDHYIAIKVDREERPDLDSIYMSFVTATTGSGGWPMSVFLTPEGKPFYGGTYFPPQPRWGSPGFKDLLLSINQTWTQQQEKVEKSAASFVAAIVQRLNDRKSSTHTFTPEILTKAYQQLEQNFDTQNGGFGHSPKFPMGHNLSFLLRYSQNNRHPQALAMVEKTLQVMAQSGLCDQLGGGFHRYSTDVHWQIPHFEKMLYDQALITMAYLDAYSSTGKTAYAQTARETLNYVLRDMRDSNGGFYSAEDADSLESDSDQVEKRKTEGAFYLWGTNELTQILSAYEMKILSFHYGIELQGNAVYDPHGEFVGKNVLHIKHSLEAVAKKWGQPLEEITQHMISIKEKLFQRRQGRARPHLDDKVLVDWNALMISAMAIAGRVLDEKQYLAAAHKAADFILSQMRRPDGRLWHRYRDGESGIPGTLDDYAFLIAALIDLYESSFQARYLKDALSLIDDMIKLFWDAERGGFYLTPADSEELIYRPKEAYDGAVPSGNSVAALNLLRLYHFTQKDEYLKKAEAVFRYFDEDFSVHPGVYCQMMMAGQFYCQPVKEIVMAGDFAGKECRAMVHYVWRAWVPQRIMILKSTQQQAELKDILPLFRGQDADGAEPCVYLCENHMCQLPAKNLEQLKRILG